MCVICKDWHLGKLSIDEAFRNLNELKQDTDLTHEELMHYWEVAEMLSEDEYDTY